LSGGALRNYALRSQKKKGWVFKKEASLAEILFLGVAPREYISGESLAFYADLVDSEKYHIPVHYYAFPAPHHTRIFPRLPISGDKHYLAQLGVTITRARFESDTLPRSN
jgi:hypothetical protein